MAVKKSVEKPIPSSPSDARWGSDFMADMLRALGMEYIALAPGAQFGATLEREHGRFSRGGKPPWRKVIKAAGIKGE